MNLPKTKFINLKNTLIHAGNTFRKYYIKKYNEVNKIVRNKKVQDSEK
jgi:hypothetical protein